MGLILAPFLSLLKAVPWWVWAGVAVLGWGAWQKHEATAATKLAIEATVNANQQKAIRDTEAKYNAAIRETADGYAKNLIVSQRNAAVVREQLGRLRVSIAASAASANSAPASSADGARAVRSVADECVVALAEMAESAGQCSAKVTGLQGYIKGTR